MAGQISRIALLLTSLGQAFAAPAEYGHCKNTPDSSEWPSQKDWNQLNSTLGGNLLAPLPPAIVCDRRHPAYSSEACSGLNDKWFTAAFHDEDPISVHMTNWQLDACLPDIAYNKSHDCDLKPFPKYTVEASDSKHIIDAVKFAQQHNIRVSVKNTGHDYLGRSTSPELSIWTHHLKRIDVHESFQAKNCKATAPSSAITVRGGNQFAEVYKTCQEHDVLIAGGAEPSVGVGGYLTGGGHSPLGAKLGLAVDNVLEMEVICPSGELLIANECQNSDLFWAMKGGGGSTFGILVSATLKTYPNYPGATFQMAFQSSEEEATKNQNKNFYELVVDLYGELIDWSDNYINGYLSFSSLETLAFLGDASSLDASDASGLSVGAAPENSSKPMLLTFGGWIHNQTDAKLNQLMGGFTKKINSTNGINGTFLAQSLPKMTDLLGSEIGQTAAGFNALIGSRLWPKEALQNRTGLLDVFKALKDKPVQALVVSGPAVRDPSKAEKVSVSSAWRKTYVHSLFASGWGYRNATETALVQDLHTNVLNKIMRDHAPDSGCYLNEADHYDPEARVAFWSDYDRLLKLKRKLDPNGLFWCQPCVGSEDWKLDDKTGRLCKV